MNKVEESNNITEHSNTNESNTDNDEKRLTPNHTFKYKKFKNVLQVKVVLHKIPPQMINFDPTTTHFHLDTLKYNKKYYLNFPYPYGIKVDIKEGEEPQATLAHGTLTAELPIKEMNEKLLPHRETLSERKKRLSKKRKEKEHREKQIAKKSDDKNNKRQKNSRQPNTTKQNPPKKRTTTTTEDLSIIEDINQKLDSIRGQKVDKETSKIEWEQNQVEKKQKKQEKENRVLTAIRESVVEKLQNQKKFKNVPVKKPSNENKATKNPNEQQSVKKPAKQNPPKKKPNPKKSQPKKNPGNTPNKKPKTNNNNNRSNKQTNSN